MNVIVLEIPMVNTTNPGHNLAGSWIHRHQPGLKKSIIVAKGIHQAEECIALTLPRKDTHSLLSVEFNIERIRAGIAVFQQAFVRLSTFYFSGQEGLYLGVIIIHPGISISP